MDEKNLKVLIQTRALLSDLLESKKREIKEIKEQLNILTDIIEQNSFQTASNLLSANMFIEKNQDLEINNVENVKKIFSNTDKEKLLAHFMFQKNIITISFLHPIKIGLTYENYIELIVKPLLTKLKKENVGLEVETIKENEFIKKIILKNVKFDIYDTVFNHIEALIKY